MGMDGAPCGVFPVCLSPGGGGGIEEGAETGGSAVEIVGDGINGLTGDGSPDCVLPGSGGDIRGCEVDGSSVILNDDSDDEIGLLSAMNFSTTNRLTSSLNSLCKLAFQISFSCNMFSRNASFSLLSSSRILSIQAINPVSRTGASGC